MPQPPISGASPDPLPPRAVSGAAGVLRGKTDDTNFEADFADLAARFAAQSGGGLSPELSADLALEIVLNEVVEQACLATGATGAAIVLQRDGEMFCRASNGSTAPDLGSRLDTTYGISGECIKTRRTQKCDDVLADSRVDVEASKRLGVRSVMVMPLLRGDELVGVFELFSSLPNAFGERDERTLEVLAARILSNMERAAQPLPVPAPPHDELPAVAEALEEVIPQIPDTTARRRYDFMTAVLGLSVLACAILLGILLGRHFGPLRGAVRVRSAATTSAANGSVAPAVDAAAPAPVGTQAPDIATNPVKTNSLRGNQESVPPGGLRVYENGKEVFRMPPSQNTAAVEERHEGEVERAASVQPERIQLSPVAAEGSLLHRVEPEYPEEARQQRIQGLVVLEVHIGGDGAVQDVQVVSGPPQLVQASSDAVKQWRFKPRAVNGHPAEMQTRVTLNFRLPG